MSNDCEPSNKLLEWRREHRPGNPPRIECDPEVKAFVDAHIVRLTFDELAAAIRARFGHERAVSKSTLHRYWQAHHARLLGSEGAYRDSIT